jgi:hypothetical protein
MFDQLVFSIRNILLIQLIIIISSAPELTLCLHQEIMKIWKKMSAPFHETPANRIKKRSTFWEIDMTKFEP